MTEDEYLERISVLEAECGRVKELYTRLRTRYIESHVVWEAEARQNVELRAAIHNLGPQ